MSRRAATPKPAPAASQPSPKRWWQRLASFGFGRKASGPPMLTEAVRKSNPARRGPRRADASHMLAALRQVLDRHATSRSVLVHLGIVEQALEHNGVQALDDVPADVLARALSQLEMLVSDWTETGIAALRAQIKAAMVKPGRLDAPAGRRKPAARPAADFDNSRLQVNEASVSTFMEARARWETSATGGR